MLIAREVDGILSVVDHREVFKDTSFTQSGPSVGFLLENSCFPVSNTKAVTDTQKLEMCAAYLEGGVVYTVRVVDKTVEELADEQEAAYRVLQDTIVAATQERMDEFARTRNYDGILSACTYATSAVPKFAAEGQYAVQARDATWAALYQFMADVQAGTQPVPSGFEDVEPLLPELAWPE